MIRKFVAWALDPLPLRVRAARRAIETFKLGTYRNRLNLDAVKRPYYGFCLFHAAQLARSLGLQRISAIEFGVAGGNGLVSMEEHAADIERETGIAFDIYGFDTGTGLPRPRDHRDLPYLWREGFFAMNGSLLRERLTRSELVIGDVAETACTFFERYHPAPIGAVSIDLDLYTSTVAALKLFTGQSEHYLPRIYFYLDDVTGWPADAYNEFSGELLAIREFNEVSQQRKFAKLELAHTRRFPAAWNERIYVLHDFAHPSYGAYIGPEDDQRPLLTG